MSGIGNCVESVQGQFIWYSAEVKQSAANDALAFWATRSSYKLLAALATNLLIAPASSRVFVE